MLKRRYQLLLLAALVLTAFYPAVLAGASKIDDSTLFKNLRQVAGWNLRSIFFPNDSGGGYYRPLIILSYIFDKLVLGLSPGLMHIENILLHLVNVILVFSLTGKIKKIVSPGEKDADSLLPLFAAVLFGLHPINSESVNWISGRTDLLAGMFVLSSALFLLKYGETSQKNYSILSVIAILGAILSKETAIAFLPGFFLLMDANRPKNNGSNTEGVVRGRSPGGNNNALILGVIGVILVAVLFRTIAFSSNTSRIGITIRTLSSDWLYSMLLVLRAFGFYMKKLFLPYPLNFAIMEVDPLYELLSVPLAALCLYITLRRTTFSAFFTTGLLLILPAFVITFGQIAWTPYAERYIYISSAFVMIAVVIYLSGVLKLRPAMPVKVLCSAAAIVLLILSIHRSHVWGNDFLLVEDTVAKSPMSRDMRALYGSMLAERGNYDEARIQIQSGSQIPLLGAYDDRFDMTLGYIAGMQGKIDEAISHYERVFQKTNRKSAPALEGLISLFETKKDSARTISEKRMLDLQLTSYKLALYDLNHDPFLLYKLGSEAAQLGQHDKAIKFFRQAAENMDDQNPYKKIARKWISILSGHD